MPYPAVQEHVFGEHNEYRLVRYTRGGERRIMQTLALSLTVDGAPSPLVQSLDGDSRYWEAVLTECLREAPPHWWELRPGPANGATQQVLTFEHVPLDEFTLVTEEAARWFQSFRQPVAPADAPGGADEPHALAPAQTVSEPFRGRAS